MQSIKLSLTSNKTRKIYIQGIAGGGKTTFAKKLIALCRSLNLIVVGCSSTNLSAQLYDGFMSAHSLFGIPVIDADDNDDNDVREIVCNLDKSPTRMELLEQTSLIIWDECFQNHLHCLDAASRLLNDFSGKVLIMMGDCAQQPPVVNNGTEEEIVAAHMFQSRLWRTFEIFKFNINLRLSALQANVDNLSQDELHHFNAQRAYADMLIDIGKNMLYESTQVILYGRSSKSLSHIWLPYVKYSSIESHVLQFLYPNGYNVFDMISATILSATNDRVDYWNNIVQKLNNEQECTMFSADEFCEVDDENDHLTEMISDHVLERYDKNGVPPHALKLKIGDICMLMRTLSRKDKLCNNTRVIIKDIKRFRIRVQLLQPGVPIYYDVPRIRFIFTMRYGKGFKMMRTQFPLRLAYAITINRSQGQTTSRTVLDIYDQPFMHGQCYVAMSRVRHYNDIMIFCKDSDVFALEGEHMCGPIIHNVVYNDLITHY
jgi:hypothetical protein